MSVDTYRFYLIWLLGQVGLNSGFQKKYDALLHLRRVKAFALDISENISEEGKPNGPFRRVGGRREDLYSRYTELCKVRQSVFSDCAMASVF